MTHALTGKASAHDAQLESQQGPEKRRDVEDSEAEEPQGEQRATPSTVPVAGLVFGNQGAQPSSQAPSTSRPPPGEIQFEWSGWELFGLPPEVKAASAQYATTIRQLSSIRADLVPTMPPELVGALISNLDVAEKGLLALARAKVAVSDRWETINGIKLYAKSIEKTVEAAKRERDEILATQARLASELEAAMAMIERLEAEEAARVEAQEAARLEAEAKKRQAQEAAEKEAAERAAAAEKEAAECAAAKVEEERKARAAEEERQRAEKEEADRARAKAEQEAQEKADRERAIAAAAREKAEKEAQEKARQEAAEQAAKSRRALFGENQGAFDAAVAGASAIADAELERAIAALQAEREKAEEASKPKSAKRGAAKSSRTPKRRTGATSEPSVGEEPQQPAKAAHDLAFEEGEREARKERDASVATRVDKYGALASATKGSGLEPEDLAWAIATSKGSVPVAEALVDLCARGPDGVAVAHQIGMRADLVAQVAACVALLTAGTSVADAVKASALLQDLDQTPRRWALDRAGSGIPIMDALRFLERHKNNKLAMLIGAVCGVSAADDDLITAVVTSKSTPSAVTWLLSQPGPDRTTIGKAVISRNLKLDDLRPIIEPYVPTVSLALALEIATTFPQQLANIPALLASNLALPQMVIVRLQLGANDSSNPFTVAAMTAEAELMSGLAGVVTCSDDDVDYFGPADKRTRNRKVDARTGLLKLPRLGATFELHVHWEQLGSMEINSMHVQINGVNGTELNQIMNFFPRLIAATVAALNAHGLTKGGTVKKPAGR